MSRHRESFVDLCLRGDVLLQDIGDFVDVWHASDHPETLQAYLGMNDQEYGLWLIRPDLISAILPARSDHVSLGDVLKASYDQQMAQAVTIESDPKLMQLSV